MFYLNFLNDKYKVPYICSTSKGENYYRIHEDPQITLQKNTHLTPKQEDPILIVLKQDNIRGNLHITT